ncbi:hypothetical protein B0H19DRAFT_1140846 [Mycena capillaripes]|nr:hypothetical protein B0H19DRAFT_1140846 [Mycena capillaripes]
MTRPLPDSSDEDDAPASPLPPPKTKAKAARRSGDDLSGNQTFETRTRQERQPSGKQNNNDKENLAATKEKLAKLQKEYDKAKRLVNKQAKSNKSAAAADDDDHESEEKDDSDGENGVSFQSSIKPLAPLPPEVRRSTPVFCKAPKDKAPPTIPSRKFWSLPENPSAGSPRSASPTSDDMDVVLMGSTADDSLDIPHSPIDAGRDGHGHDDDDPSSPSAPRGRSLQETAPATSRKRPNQQPASSPPPVKRKRKEPQFAENYVTTAGVRPKASDYEPMVRALLLRAMAEYCMLILTLNAFPDLGLQLSWAKTCFRNACSAANQRYSTNERMLKLITKRGSWIRGQVISACRLLFAPHYHFNRGSASTAAIKGNEALSKKLAKDALYHYKDMANGTGYGENGILLNIRKAVVFKDKHSIGVIFASKFELYPFPLLALEFAALQLCNREWSTGKFVASAFAEKEVGESYKTHLQDIQRWAEYDTVVIDKLRRKWYKRASQSLGPVTAADAATHISVAREDALRAELAGRTGDTDSEPEQIDGDAEP